MSTDNQLTDAAKAMKEKEQLIPGDVIQHKPLNPASITSMQPATPMVMLQTALDKGASIEMIEKFMDLVERSERNEARKAYVKAMSQFKTKEIKLIKDSSVNYGTTSYNHESLGYICNVLIPAMGEYGLSHRWDFLQADGQITVTTVITHELGHSEKTPLTSPPDNSGGKNSIQAIGSAVKYLERYTFLAAVGMASSEKDDDGRDSEPMQFITPEQVTEIDDLIAETCAEKEAFLKYCRINSLPEMPANKYNQAITALKDRK